MQIALADAQCGATSGQERIVNLNTAKTILVVVVLEFEWLLLCDRGKAGWSERRRPRRRLVFTSNFGASAATPSPLRPRPRTLPIEHGYFGMVQADRRRHGLRSVRSPSLLIVPRRLIIATLVREADPLPKIAASPLVTRSIYNDIGRVTFESSMKKKDTLLTSGNERQGRKADRSARGGARARPATSASLWVVPLRLRLVRYSYSYAIRCYLQQPVSLRVRLLHLSAHVLLS
ncbi:hypothetical protein MSG28_011066 [Choristoneura fumiferana]|uniref:Uncharacterized protein n=1 Tax=Choristoneura fumiferana TaxID=7141 RepID=A0ACC0KQ91_CHOFU|nr:hypothetical protein MSG28_011066 [Choristoneura fumiferana]